MTDEGDAGPELPYVDVHSIRVSAPRTRVWDALEAYAAKPLGGVAGVLLPRVLGTDPPQGFAVEERVPHTRLRLAGRHRFSRYRLTFDLEDGGDGATLVHARTNASFPGLHGGIYRMLVIGTRAHVVATRGILRSVERRCAGPSAT